MFKALVHSAKPLVQVKALKPVQPFVFRCLSTEVPPATEEKAPEVNNDAEVIKKLQEENKSLKDQALRAMAEGENTRRIAQRDVENARAYANSSFAKAMLEIADDLERAIAAIPPEHRNSEDPKVKTLVSGIEMTEKNLQKIFHQFGVVKYGTVNDKFDPNLHDALYKMTDNENPDTVGQIVKFGYKIKDRVLRPAQVGARVKSD